MDAGGVWVLDSCPAPDRAPRRRMAAFVAGAVCFAVSKSLEEVEIQDALVPALSKEWWRRHRVEADAHAGGAPTAGDWTGDVAIQTRANAAGRLHGCGVMVLGHMERLGVWRGRVAEVTNG
eukprot:gene28771-35713_t